MSISDTKLEQFNQLRPLLFSAAYRMLGTRADAEDILQDAYLKWQETDESAIQSPRAFLLTVVSRLGLDSLKSARRKRETYVGPWLPEPLIAPAVDTAELSESLSIAFLHVMESLAPAERVAFLLREVFGEEFAAIAEVLDTTDTNVRQLVSRARKHLREKRPRFEIDRERHEQILTRFVQACAFGSPADLVGLLKEDAILYSDGGGKTSAALNPIYGADRIARFLVGIREKANPPMGGHFAIINGEPGFVSTLGDRMYAAVTIDVDSGARIRTVFCVLNPEKLGP